MAESFHWENTSYVSDIGLISQVYEEVKKKKNLNSMKSNKPIDKLGDKIRRVYIRSNINGQCTQIDLLNESSDLAVKSSQS